MSVKINIDAVEGVLLVDGWYTVADKAFDIDSYEFSGEGGSFEANASPRLLGGQEKLLPSVGARWIEPDGAQVFCPLTAALAVRYAPKAKKKK